MISAIHDYASGDTGNGSLLRGQLASRQLAAAEQQQLAAAEQQQLAAAEQQQLAAAEQQQLAAAEQQSRYGEHGAVLRSRQPLPVVIQQSDIADSIQDRRGTFRKPRRYRGRLTGPVMFVRGLLESWKLDRGAAVFLLGFEQSDGLHVEKILDGAEPLIGRDTKDRIAYLYRIRSTLSALFRNEDVENEWLREPRALLGERTPMELLREGSMENLLLVKEYVEEIVGI